MRTLVVLAVMGTLAVAGCERPASSTKQKGAAPAKVEKLPQETEISRITLTRQAEARLGITFASVVNEDVQRRRVFGGDVTIPAGKSTIVSAPVPGTIEAPSSGAIPLPGQQLQAGESVMRLVPLLSPERYVPSPADRVQMTNARASLMSALTVAQGDVQRGQAEVDAAVISLDRAEKLLSDKAGSARAADDARALLNVAKSTVQAAQERARQIEKLLADLDANGSNGQATPLLMTSPQSGVMRNLSVTRGQAVTVGATLFEVVDTRNMWIRVPIYVGLLPEIHPQASALIVGLDGREGLEPRQARPITAPPTADPLSSTADLYFEVDDADGHLRPGQRVGVQLALQGQQEARVVPAKSILYDIYGGTWVYLKAGEQAFQRQRVLVRYTQQDRAILAEGPVVGSEVVVDGAAELYGTEFGAGK